MKRIELDSFSAFRFPARLRAGVNGGIAFLLKQADMEENKYKADLWLYRDGAEIQLTTGGDAAAFWWRGEDIVFTRTAKPEGADAFLPRTKLYTISTTGPGEARETLALEGAVTDLAFLPDGRLLYLATYSPAAEKALAGAGGDRDKAAKALEQQQDVQVIDELPWWNNGGGLVNRCRSRLYLYENGRHRPLTDELTEVEAFSLTPDESTCYYTATPFDGVCGIENKLFQLDLATLGSREITLGNPYQHHKVVPLATGEVVVFGSDMQEYGINQNCEMVLLQPETGRKTTLDDSGLYAIYDSVNSDLKLGAAPQYAAVGTDVYWVSTLDDSAHLMKLTREGEIRRVTREPGCVSELCVANGGLYFTAMRGTKGVELYRLGADGAEQQLTHWNDAAAEGFGFTAPHRLSFIDEEGNEISGFVYEPPGRAPGTLCPAVLYIHGGPKTVYGPVAFHEMQLLASRGFAVLLCNPVGSDGKGNEFADIRGRYGLIDYTDLLAFVDEALGAFPWIDGLRVGVCGGSYGGYMTNWIVGHTDRFKAAVSQRGISNWTTMQLISDIGAYFVPDQAAADPWHSTQTLWEQSPLSHATAVNTPLLLLHSDEDYRCPLPEAMQMYAAIKARGVDTRLVVFKGENHELSRGGKPGQRVRRLREILAWLETHLLDG